MIDASPDTNFFNHLKVNFYWPILVLFLLVPWAIAQSHYAMREDIAWLVEVANRLFKGGIFYKDIYEVNFPLSTIIYMPIAVIANITGLATHYLYFYYTCFLLLLSVLAINRLVKKYNFLGDADRIIFITAYILSCTVCARFFDFAQREQIIFMGLLPLLLLQTGITLHPEIEHGREFWFIMIFGGIAAMIKPHYCLFPFASMIVRMIHQKRFFVLLDMDFLILMGAGLIYLLMLLTIFQDYTFKIMPDALLLYAAFSDMSGIIKECSILCPVLLCLFIASVIVPNEKRVKGLIRALLGCSVIAFIPYIIQMKGFAYHSFPLRGFMVCAAGLIGYGAVSYFVKLPLALLMTIFLLIMISYGVFPPSNVFPTHESYKNLELSKRVEACGENCHFFIYVMSGLDTAYSTAYYTNTIHSSRFINMWIMSALSVYYQNLQDGKPSLFTKSDLDRYAKKYAHMVAEDFAEDKPALVLICDSCSQGMKFNFLSFAKIDPEFARNWHHYKKTDHFIINRGTYYRGSSIGFDDPMTFTQYQRTGE
jgi:hypothetical protein